MAAKRHEPDYFTPFPNHVHASYIQFDQTEFKNLVDKSGKVNTSHYDPGYTKLKFK